jgi:hypothetical protein
VQPASSDMVNVCKKNQYTTNQTLQKSWAKERSVAF